MPRTSFHAWLSGGSLEVVMDMLRAWLQADDLKVRDRIAGTEIVYDGKGLYVFCHEDLPASGSCPDYLMEGKIDADLEAAAERLRPLLQICASRQMEIGLDYVAIDEKGRHIGEEVALR